MRYYTKKKNTKKGGGELLRCDLRGVHDGGGKISNRDRGNKNISTTTCVEKRGK